ncbi:MAG TPA: hypothetical protein VGB22_09145 [candidate division Zixibacteria bacterium]|jgi:hypothetical protein
MDRESITLITAIIGAVCGVTGAVLGVINIWHQIRRGKVRLRVTPTHAMGVGGLEDSPINFCIEVLNLSEFPVVVEDVGLRVSRRTIATFRLEEGLDYPGKLPQRLEPHTSYKKCVSVTSVTTDWQKVRTAYARTQCGVLVTGFSPALKQLIRQYSLKKN